MIHGCGVVCSRRRSRLVLSGHRETAEASATGPHPGRGRWPWHQLSAATRAPASPGRPRARVERPGAAALAGMRWHGAARAARPAPGVSGADAAARRLARWSEGACLASGPLCALGLGFGGPAPLAAPAPPAPTHACLFNLIHHLPSKGQAAEAEEWRRMHACMPPPVRTKHGADPSPHPAFMHAAADMEPMHGRCRRRQRQGCFIFTVGARARARLAPLARRNRTMYMLMLLFYFFAVHHPGFFWGSARVDGKEKKQSGSAKRQRQQPCEAIRRAARRRRRRARRRPRWRPGWRC